MLKICNSMPDIPLLLCLLYVRTHRTERQKISYKDTVLEISSSTYSGLSPEFNIQTKA